jgi:putative hemolysin
MEIALLFVLIVLNGLFAMSEIALVTARKGRLQRMVDEGDTAAAAALDLGQTPTRFMSTVQIGITSISILNGIVGEAALAQPFGDWLSDLGLPQPYTHYAATALVVIAVTYFSIVLGELVPKRIGQIGAESIAKRVARPMLWLATIARPFVRLLSVSTDIVLRILGARSDTGPSVTSEEIHALLEEGSDAGVIEEQEHAMVRNVFRLDERQITSLMVPRTDVVVLDVREPLAENINRVERSEHSRFPVVDGSLRNAIGVTSARNLLAQSLRGEPLDLKKNLQPPVYVPETLTGMELLENFRASGTNFVFVIDEYGEVLGIVTPQDVMEAITGEFKPRKAEDAWAIARADGSWLLDGQIPIPELKDRLRLESVPEEDKARFHTLSGMLMLLMGRIPQTSEQVDWQGWRFEVMDLDGKRIDKVLATHVAEAQAAPDTDARPQPPRGN